MSLTCLDTTLTTCECSQPHELQHARLLPVSRDIDKIESGSWNFWAPSCLTSHAQLFQSLSHVWLFVNPMDCSTPGFPDHHLLLELAQTHVHRVGDALQSSYPLLSPSPPAFNLSQHQDHQWKSLTCYWYQPSNGCRQITRERDIDEQLWLLMG